MNIANFNQRLHETISWCLSQEIIRGKAYTILAPYERANWISRWLARNKIRQAGEIRREGEQLMATADAGSIVPPLRHQLRSEALRPFAQSLARWEANRIGIAEKVTLARSQILRQSGKRSDSEDFDLCGGRLLLYAPEDNLADGAAEYVSLGFFDVDNVPPWDTWIAVYGKYLVSWVPAQLFRFVQEGLDVNPEQCILWADDPSLSTEPIAAVLSQFISKVA